MTTMNVEHIEKDLVLTYAEKSSPLWAALRIHLERKLHYAQRRLEQSLAEQDTNIVRGEISALRSLLRLEDDPIVFPTDDDQSVVR